MLLGTAACLAAFLLVFLLYVNKRRWFSAVGRANRACCDDAIARRASTPVAIRATIPTAKIKGNSRFISTPKSTNNKIPGRCYGVDVSDSSSETESMTSVQRMENTENTVRGVFRDPMSLAEKGRVALSSNSSCCSSTTSSVGVAVAERHATSVVQPQDVNHT